jgi:hypothetical protein
MPPIVHDVAEVFTVTVSLSQVSSGIKPEPEDQNPKNSNPDPFSLKPERVLRVAIAKT